MQDTDTPNKRNLSAIASTSGVTKGGKPYQDVSTDVMDEVRVAMEKPLRIGIETFDDNPPIPEGQFKGEAAVYSALQ